MQQTKLPAKTILIQMHHVHSNSETGPHTYARTQTSFSSNKAKIVSKNLHPKTVLV